MKKPVHQIKISLGKLDAGPASDGLDPDMDNDSPMHDPDQDETGHMPVHVVIASIKKHPVKKSYKK